MKKIFKKKNDSSSKAQPTFADFEAKTHELNRINKTIAVLSGKGGVGKSLVTSLLGIAMQRKGYNIGILDADITGPSIPKIFGIEKKKAVTDELGLYPVKTRKGLKVISINLLLDNADDPVIWRGPLIANAVKQFWTDVIWGDLDYLFFDMPPGTGDIPLTVFQSIPLTGIIIVTSPQDLVALIVKKAYNMAKMMEIPILGIIENLSYTTCPNCGEKINLFGESKSETVAKEMNIPFLGRLPIDPNIASLCDKGELEEYEAEYMNPSTLLLESLSTK